MRKLFTLSFLIATATSILAHTHTSRTDSSRVFIGNLQVGERMESMDIARKNVILALKKDLETLEKNAKSSIFMDISTLSKEAVINAESYAAMLAKLDKKYKADAKTIETDNIRDIFQIDQKSDIKRRHSNVVSAQCFNAKTEGLFFKMKDYANEEIVSFPLETLKGNSRYGLVENYHQGFARIKKDQVYGFLNFCGEEFIPCQYEKTDNFNDGKALVKKFDWYFVDMYGNESDALENVVDAQALRSGISIAKFKNGKMALIDNSYDVSKKTVSDFFDEISNFNKDLLKVKQGKGYGLIKLDGSIKIDAIYDNLNPAAEQGKWMIIEQNKKMGLMDTEGNIKIKPSFSQITPLILDPTLGFSASLGIAKDETGVHLVDFNDLRTSKTYLTIGEFNKYGLAPVKDGKYVGFINTDLKVVIEPIYRSIGTFNQYGLVSACKDGVNNSLKCGYLQQDGTEIIPLQFDEVANFNKLGLVVVRENVKNCSLPSGNCKVDMVYDKAGTLIIGKTNEAAPIGIKYTTTDTLFNNNYIVIKTFTPNTNGDEELEYNLIERNSLHRITNTGYKSIRKYDSNYLFPVMKDGKWGLIDTSGKVVTKPAYKEMMYATEGLYGVKFDNNKYGFIDKKGKIQISFDYDEVRPFNNNLSIVSKGPGKLGVINRFNAKIAPCYFTEINILPATKQFELIDNIGSKFILNSNGDCVTNCTRFDEIRKLANQ